ncbi:MAG: DUF1934 family protein [Anaeroplasmataceae bacterium]
MKSTFISICDGESTKFDTNLKIVENKYIFKDNSQENVFTTITIGVESIIIERTGTINSIMNLRKKIKSKSIYDDKKGLYFEYETILIDFKISNTGLFINYNIHLDEDQSANYKLYLLIK